MGKVYPKEKTQSVKGRRCSRISGNTYLNLAQLHYCNPSGLASIAGNCCCIDLGKKRVAVLHASKSVKGHNENVRVFDKSLMMILLVNLVSYDVGSSSSQNSTFR